MNCTSRTQTSYDFGHNLTEIADHLVRTRGFHRPISLAVIDPQGQMMWQTLKTDEAGVIAVEFLRRLFQSLLRHSARPSLDSPTT